MRERISILTTVTDPWKRQDRWLEALNCYLDFADEVVVVNGGSYIALEQGHSFDEDIRTGKLKMVELEWPYEWSWIELPKHLNAGREKCTGDWIIKLDIDQLFHEKDFDQIRKKLAGCPKDCQVATFQKMSMVYGGKYYQKGGQPIAFRNEAEISIGKNLDKGTDLCFAVKRTGTEIVELTPNLASIGEGGGVVGEDRGVRTNTENKQVFELPVGTELLTFKTGIQYWNYDYFFKTQEFTKKEFWRFSRAYHRYYGNWDFGSNEEASFKIFLGMLQGRYNRSPYTYKLEDHPKYIRKEVEKIMPEQFGHSAWGLLKL